MSKADSLYNRDFVSWTEQQAALLRKAEGSNLPLDWQHLAEEIEGLGKFDRRELTSHVTRILRHLFKLAVSPRDEPRSGWQESIEDSRGEIEILLADSPSLRREVAELIGRQSPAAARRAAADLARQGEPTEGVHARLEHGGFTAEEVLRDWFPDRPD
jgi:Domain of unknown function DUF29